MIVCIASTPQLKNHIAAGFRLFCSYPWYSSIFCQTQIQFSETKSQLHPKDNPRGRFPYPNLFVDLPQVNGHRSEYYRAMAVPGQGIGHGRNNIWN